MTTSNCATRGRKFCFSSQFNVSNKLLPILVTEDHVFLSPAKLVKTVEDMQLWDKSEAYFVSSVN